MCAVVERNLASLDYPNLRILQDQAQSLDPNGKVLTLASGEALAYDKLCVATGARPKQLSDLPHVIMLRDNSTIQVR